MIPWDGSQEHYLEFGEPAYLAGTNVNLEFDTTVLRYGYTSMTTPSSIYDYDMVTREKTLLKQEEVLGGFDAAGYHTERLHATAGDGVRVPISMVYRKGMERNGRSPLLLYGYGSYGHSLDATFGSARLSLLDPGLRVRHRPRSGWRGDGAGVVRGRQAAQQEKHLHRLHRLRRTSDRTALHQPGTGCSPWAGVPAAC